MPPISRVRGPKTPENPRRSGRPGLLRRCLAAVALAMPAGCAAPSYFDGRSLPTAGLAASSALAPGESRDPRQLPMFTGQGDRIDWRTLHDAIAWADVILVGEEHDDGVGHAVELAVAEEVLAVQPGAAVSLEMLERDEQRLVDDYFDGVIDAPTFIKLTDSAGWATGGGTWENWYQPLIDAAKGGRGRVIAANAPRRYVRLARTDGYERLLAMRGERRAFFDVPTSPVDDAYERRFIEVMTQADEPAAASPATQPAATAPAASAATASATMSASGGHAASTHGDMIGAAFRSQLVWDTTMAASIARARQLGIPKIVHFVGQFHVDYRGGTYQQLRKRLPGARILTITMQRANGGSLRNEDRGRADVVIYTGERPETGEEAATRPATQPK